MGFPGKNTGVGCHFLQQGVFPTQGSYPCLLYWQEDSLPLSHLASRAAQCLSHKGCSLLNECWLKTNILSERYDFDILRGSLEKAMATHCSTLAWKIPSVEVPGRLQSMGSLRVGHDWVTSLSLFTFIHWRRKCKPTPVFLPGESQGRGRLVGCRLWGRTESDKTEAT